MRSKAILLCLALLLEGCFMVSGLPWERLIIARGCMCQRETSHFISPQLYQRIQIIPQGGRCQRKEIIIHLRNKNVICLKPDTRWVEMMIFHIQKRQRLANENGSNASGRRSL
ncbi:C-X-C motif chemokine 13-like [Spea bombifrons]|uniref:C-X-C motif chemokine 13-like n=1 Tax=Spea bombifrons TaxID=233779 RepID=UPI00234909AA|nr:C-X-C motif chemokine 13-like [Spea bombifrons]